MPIQAGQLRHRATIQNPITSVVDGEPRDAYVPVGDVSCRVRRLSSDEVLAAAQLQQTVTHAVRMRYRGDVDHRTRLLWHGRRLDVVVADEDEDRAALDLRCQEWRA